MGERKTQSPVRRRRRLRRAARLIVLCAIGLPAAVVATLSACGRAALNRVDTTVERDAETGVMLRAKARELGPTAADGATTAVLLLHGFLGTREDFGELGPRLAEAGFHVREARLPGHGTTPADFARQTSSTLYLGAASDLRELKAEYPAVDVVGFSMGGALATLLAAREGCDRLVLASPYFGVTYRWYYGLPPRTWLGAMGWAFVSLPKSERFIKVNRRDDVGKWYTYRAVPTSGVHTLMNLGDAAGDEATLRAVGCPVLMVMSRGDEAASPAAAEAAFGKIASTEKRAVWFTRDNHVIFWDYDRGAVIEEILGFLESNPNANERE